RRLRCEKKLAASSHEFARDNIRVTLRQANFHRHVGCESLSIIQQHGAHRPSEKWRRSWRKPASARPLRSAGSAGSAARSSLGRRFGATTGKNRDQPGASGKTRKRKGRGRSHNSSELRQQLVVGFMFLKSGD